MDPRKILGVDSNATPEEIQKAYREKVKKHHPDMGGDVWAFQQVNQAYEMLVAPSKRPINNKPKSPSSEASGPVANPSSKPQTESKRESKMPDKGQSNPTPRRRSLSEQLFAHRELPLQNETTFFIFINVMDIFMTYILLRFGAMEANPIANYFFREWGFNGMIAFKLVIVLIVCLIAQFVATRKLQTGRALLNVGSLIVSIVVVYSAILFYQKFVI